jgi:hypothetical protein
LRKSSTNYTWSSSPGASVPYGILVVIKRHQLVFNLVYYEDYTQKIYSNPVLL